MAAIGSFIDWIGSIIHAIEKFSDLSRFMAPLPKKSSFEGDGFGGLGIIPANFHPGQRQQVLQPIKLDLNVDGRMLAQTVADIFEDLYTHPTSGPAANGWNQFRSVDGNVVGT
jgi:hypothetical protein